ncbi:hypothetical protein OESDEN_00383 [Oesophagostomum dentatum]|uniref:MD-2-related lipid-recognition domain-containing protein n=1 Tax=Oesophagostomum dentatum TaxID=61180 RepID=A0A0B1TUT8_OESDE|nr:hypothetical protein OESDEN_00383 [Oesophagostomum dentatum]
MTSALLPNYLDPGNGFRAMRPLDDPRQMRNYQFRRNEVSVEDSLDAGKVQSYLQAPIMDHDADGERCEALPNGTSTKPSFFMCKEDTLVTLHGGAITNMNGDDRYPVDFESPLRVFLDITSVAPRRYDNLGLEVSLYKRSTGWFGCGWMFLPSFGMLSNYDMCADNPSCPLSPGRQVLEFTIDPTRLFTRLFRMIHSDMSAYQLVIRMRDNKDPFNDLLCTTIQMRVHL